MSTHRPALPSATAALPPLVTTRVFDQLRLHSLPTGEACLSPDAPMLHGHPLLLVWWRAAGVLRQRGHATRVPAGSLCFLPFDAAVRLSAAGPGGAVALELPAQVFARARERVAGTLGTTIGTDTGAPAILRSFVDTLDRQPAAYRPDYAGWVQACVCELAEGVLAECASAQPTAAQRAVLAARDYVVTHLTDLDLTPNRVAHEAAVSLRTLNRLFAAEGDSVGGLIRRHRLERCREDLRDPGKRERSIAQIRSVWGFLDPAHFSRTFKDAYGCSPRAYRTRAAARWREGDARGHRVA